MSVARIDSVCGLLRKPESQGGNEVLFTGGSFTPNTEIFNLKTQVWRTPKSAELPRQETRVGAIMVEVCTYEYCGKNKWLKYRAAHISVENLNEK